MATLRDIRKRIRAVKSTTQITKAMEMVAAARLRRAQQMVEQSRPYSEKMRLILEQISAAAGSDQPSRSLNSAKSSARCWSCLPLIAVSADRSIRTSFVLPPGG